MTAVRRGGELITVTSRERTLVDCLYNLKWAGGLEEVLRSVGGFPSLDTERVVAYLSQLGSATTSARVGWVLSADPDLWRVTPGQLEAIRSQLGNGPYYLDKKVLPQRLVKDWWLYVPANVDPVEELRS